jgi:two-component system cell cycle response regulator DivK
MSKKALVVDDNRNNLMLETDLLTVAGFEVLEADDASGGIALAQKRQPDIIVMDVRLPDMRGTEAAKILRRDKRTCDIPIVFVTASVMAEGLEEIKDIPNSGFIGKPINTRTFVKEICRFMRKKVLVIEDNASNLMLEKDLLEISGFEVFEAENASSGIMLAKKEKPDMIIMDMQLPGMRGSEAAMILRRDKETRNTPIVFVAAAVTAEGLEEIRGITKCGFIGKPINTRTFAKEVRQYLV